MTNKSLTIFDQNRATPAAMQGLDRFGTLNSWTTSKAQAGAQPYASMSIRPSTFIDAAISDETIRFERSITELKNPPSPAALAYSSDRKPIAERLFDATASVKILTSQVAMHLDREWRQKLFRQLDSLHDPAEWEPGDAPLQQSSFATFLKAICQIQPKRRPGLGMSGSGHLIAAWTAREDRLTVEFLPNDRVRWVLTRNSDDGPERFAAQTSVARLYDGLAPYHPDHWFSNEEN